MNTTTIRRHRPQKPVRLADHLKHATNAEALQLLNEFMKEARKEIRKHDYMSIKGMASKTECSLVTFIGESFSLTITFKERIAV